MKGFRYQSFHIQGKRRYLENDIIGKYVEKLMGIEKKEESKLEHEKKTGITMEFLEEFGF